jgi:hypothetical protein
MKELYCVVFITTAVRTSNPISVRMHFIIFQKIKSFNSSLVPVLIVTLIYAVQCSLHQSSKTYESIMKARATLPEVNLFRLPHPRI